jgi:endonuclease/exonuclease/phosphatase family metal-dependent hydrolase
VASALASLDPLPDVVCMQEVETASFRSSWAHRKAHPDETQLEAFMGRMDEVFGALGREMPYDAYYFRAHRYGVGEFSLYTTGLAILVHRGRLQVDRHNSAAPARITHNHVQSLQDFKQSRICAHMRLTTREGAPLHVFNTHLSLPTPFAREFWTTKDKMGCGINQLHEARALATLVRQHSEGEPFLVCGDFNSPPGSPVFNYLAGEAGMTCAQQACGQIDGTLRRAFPTAGFMHLRMHLDHIFSGGVRWLDADGTRPYGDPKSIFYGLSDHMPLIARFALDAEPARASIAS